MGSESEGATRGEQASPLPGQLETDEAVGEQNKNNSASGAGAMGGAVEDEAEALVRDAGSGGTSTSKGGVDAKVAERERRKAEKRAANKRQNSVKRNVSWKDAETEEQLTEVKEYRASHDGGVDDEDSDHSTACCTIS